MGVMVENERKVEINDHCYFMPVKLMNGDSITYTSMRCFALDYGGVTNLQIPFVITRDSVKYRLKLYCENRDLYVYKAMD